MAIAPSKLELPYEWRPLRPHPCHAAMWKSKARFIAAVAGRGSGKTEIARRKIVLSLGLKKPWPEPIYIYALPIYQQARRVAWNPIVRMIPKEWLNKDSINKSESCITTVFGSKLYIVGMDKPQRIEGMQIDGIVIDESSDQRPGMFQKTVVPMLTHRNAWCWRIGVPKKAGIGRAEFKEFFDKGRKEPDSGIESYTWKSADILLPEELDFYRSITDPQTWLEQYEATWLDAGGSVYYNFRSINKNDDIAVYDSTLPIVVGCDFNVDPMCWCLSHFVDGRYLVFDEILLRNTNTKATLDFLYAKYGTHLAGWRFYGDASARARKTSASRTDYLIIKNDERFKDKKVFFPEKNPKLQDRYASVNAAFGNAKGEAKTFVHSRCKRLIADFEIVSYKEGTTEVEDYDGTDINHMADSFGYVVMRLTPMKLIRDAKPTVVTR